MNKETTSMHPELRMNIEFVAEQCRHMRAMRCWVRFGLATLALTCFVTLILALVHVNSTSGAILLGGYILCVVAGLVALVIRPLRVPITLRQVALYIDEHHPELENRIVSAIDLAGKDQEVSPWMIEQFLNETIPIVRQTPLNDLFDVVGSLRLIGSFAALVIMSLAVIGIFRGLWLPSLSFIMPTQSLQVEALPFSVEPGNARVRLGDNQMILIRSDEPDQAVTLKYRIGNGIWNTMETNRSSAENVSYHQFDNIQIPIQYQAQLGRRQSEVFLITPWTPPEVESITVSYTYPEYTGLPSREDPNSGNVTALEGTNVDLSVWVNKKIARAEMVLDSGETIPLSQVEDTLWSVPFTVAENDAYRVMLFDLDEEASEYNPEYTITANRDRPPEIKIDFPRGDSEVTSLEEVEFDFRVADDYGFDNFGIQYEIAGNEPVRIALNTESTVVTSADGHHDFPLESLGLEVGDFITWTIWAKDSKPDRDEFEVLGDPFFLEIRPFKKRFSEAMSGAGQGGAQADDDMAQAQKEILIATWNLRRESRYMDNEEFEEKRDIVVESQEKLLEKVKSADGMPGGDTPPEIPKLIESMQRSVDALTRSALPDPKTELSEATTHQQVANRLIARLKPRDAQVQQTQDGGGGGGGGERPDIGDLEMERNRNFYEEEKVTQAQQEAVDEVMNRIKELAQRQTSVNDELAKLISELKNAKTEEEKQRIQRKLEQLEEEIKKNLERLDDARRKMSSENMDSEQSREAKDSLDNARHQMNRTLELMEKEELQKARSVSARAVDALEDIQEQLRQFSRGAAAQRMNELVEQMEELAKKQHDIMDKTEESLEKHQSPNLDDPNSAETIKNQILNQKESLEDEFVDMMNEASELAERGKDSQELMTRNLGDWLRETSKEGILEDMQESLPLIKYDIWESATRQEMGITEKMDEALKKLAHVQDSLVEDELAGMQKALGHLDNLMDSAEMRELAKEFGADGNEGQQEPAPGQAGDPGNPSQQSGQPDPNGDQQGLVPGENGEPQRMAQQQPGEEQGQQPGQQSGGQEPGQQPGQQQGGQQPGSQPGQQPGGQQPGQQPGGSPSQNNNANGGSSSSSGQDRGDMMRQFASGGYREWLQEIRDAEALLPENSPIREQLRDVREEVEAIRRDWKARALAPQFDLFLEVAGQPLVEAANRLQREIEKILDEKEFVLTDEGEIPERYKERVAEYFKELSEAEQIQ